MKIQLLILFLVSSFSVAALPPGYQSLTANQKEEILWDSIESTSYAELGEELPVKKAGLMDLISAMTKRFVRKSFTTVSDEMPFEVQSISGKSVRREKVIHAAGSTAMIEFIPAKRTRYTGVFAKKMNGIARLSLAVGGGFTPGLGIKFLLDGRPSVNLQVMHSLTANLQSCNPFEKDFSNIIPKPTGALWLIARAFRAIAKERGGSANHLTLDHLASTEENLWSAAPYKIILAADAKAKRAGFMCNTDFRDTLATIPEGTRLYTVFGNASKESAFEEIGQIVLKRSFIASKYGDEVLFFQHDIRKK